eukprot:6171622-Pyramimonas_sp.AAC.1
MRHAQVPAVFHRAAEPLEGRAALRPARDGQNDARQGGGDGVQDDLLQYFRLERGIQMEGRLREAHPGALRPRQ